jgi:dolichol kinase
MLELLLKAVAAFTIVVLFQIAVARLHLMHAATKRRLQHVATGHMIVRFSQYIQHRSMGVIALLAGCAAIYYARVYQPQLFVQYFGSLMRDDERQPNNNKLPGAFWFLLGTAITFGCFEDRIGRYAVECLAWADPMASWIGSAVHSPRINASTTVAGSCACFLTCVVIGVCYLESVGQIIAGSVACCLAEASLSANDNLTIPIMAALAVSLISGRV